MAKGTLEVMLVEAKGINRKNFPDRLSCLIPWNCCGKYVDTYVTLQFGEQKLTSTVARGEGRKTIWNEKFKFNVEYPSTGDEEDKDDHTYKLIIRIINKHIRHSHDEFVGEATIYVKDILSLGVEKGKTELGASKYRVVRSDKTYNGQISAAVNFTLDV